MRAPGGANARARRSRRRTNKFARRELNVQLDSCRHEFWGKVESVSSVESQRSRPAFRGWGDTRLESTGWVNLGGSALLYALAIAQRDVVLEPVRLTTYGCKRSPVAVTTRQFR